MLSYILCRISFELRGLTMKVYEKICFNGEVLTTEEWEPKAEHSHLSLLELVTFSWPTSIPVQIVQGEFWVGTISNGRTTVYYDNERYDQKLAQLKILKDTMRTTNSFEVIRKCDSQIKAMEDTFRIGLCGYILDIPKSPNSSY